MATDYGKYVIGKFREQGQTLREFHRNSVYDWASVQQTASGRLESAKIRRDMSKYLGYSDWQDLMRGFSPDGGDAA